MVDKDFFIKIPNIMINDESSLIRKYGDKFFLVYIYLERRKTIEGISHITLLDCIEKCKYKPKSGKGKVNDQFKDTFISLKESGFLNIDIDFKKIKIHDFIECKLNNVESDFFQLTLKEIDLIFNYKGKEDFINILKVYSSIKSKIYRNEKNLSCCITGNYEVAFPSYERILRDTNLKSKSTLKSCLDVLIDELKLLVVGNNGDRVKKSTGEVKRDNNTYSLNSPYGIENLKGALKYLKAQNEELGWKYIKAKDNRSLGGKKSQLKRKIENGKATIEDIKELEEIQNTLDKNKYKSIAKEEKEDLINNQAVEHDSFEFESDEYEDLNIVDFWGEKVPS